MPRTRISTTVDADLLAVARRSHAAPTDAELIDAALTALMAQYRAAEIDAAYVRAYRMAPLDDTDDWGDLASWRTAASAT